MAKYGISGIWKDSNNVITHYAFHTVEKKEASKALKTPRVKAIKLLEKQENSAITWVWNYSTASWKKGGVVEVVNGKHGKYLGSNHDNTKIDNLDNLLDYDWIA